MAENQEQQKKPTGQERAMQQANQAVLEIKRRLEVKREEIRHLLGDDVRAQKLMMGALMKAADDPKIRDCEPNSVVRAVIQAALAGAEIAAGLGEGYLVPYRNKDLGVDECQFMPGYRLGQRRIQEATGLRVIADVVCENDEHWKYSQVPLVLEHTPADGEPTIGQVEGARGKMQRAYAVALDDDGRVRFAQIATAGDIDEAKKASRKGRDNDSPAWRDWEDRMWRKVAIMRLAKEVRGFKTNDMLDRMLEAEAVVHTGERASLGDLPTPRVLPPPAADEPREGVHSFGARRQAAAIRAAETEPPHDARTGEVKQAPAEKPAEQPKQETKQEPPKADASGQTSLGWGG